ncbi:motility associated factor glycosyltransferase family protein [Haloimpatiens sp. FM7330]|uniref:motility associated factor glycosyltransferase family protein n=1 Tax=Haloimpatiens sp. FM7330 TaxID=3298610 RepID=UPI003633D7E9
MNAITQYTLKNIDFRNVDEYTIEKSKDNKNIIRILKNDKYIYLGSKYSVDRDIKNFYKKLGEINEETIIIIFGLGAGEHVLKILNDTKYNKILVVEPDVSVIKTFLKLNTSKDILENDRFILSLYKKNQTKDIITSIITQIDSNNVEVLEYSNYDRIYESEFKEFFKKCIEVIEKCLINMNTEMFFSKKMIQVYLDNIKNIIKSVPINYYKNICKSMPAIVVSAGPSLSKNIHKLKDVQHKFIIICGARTLKPLLDVGVIPDFVCIIDPVDANLQFVQDSRDYSAKIVFCEVSNFRTVNAYKGNKIIFKEEFNFKKLSDSILEYKLDSLWNGGSVAHTCTSFANYIGCNKIIFIGQDLAYTNNKYHDDKADFGVKNNGKIEEENTIYVDDIYGNKVMTSKILNFYKKNLEEYIDRVNDVEFINATEGGANIKGTKIMNLQEVINEHEDNINKEILNTKIDEENKKIFNKEKIISNLKSTIEHLNRIDDKSKKILNSIEQIDKKGIKINKKSIKILKDVKINNKKIQKLEILNSLINPIINKIVSKSEYRENSKDNDLQRIKKLIEQTKPIYEAFIQAVKDVNPMIDKLINELEGEKYE